MLVGRARPRTAPRSSFTARRLRQPAPSREDWRTMSPEGRSASPPPSSPSPTQRRRRSAPRRTPAPSSSRASPATRSASTGWCGSSTGRESGGRGRRRGHRGGQDAGRRLQPALLRPRLVGAPGGVPAVRSHLPAAALGAGPGRRRAPGRDYRGRGRHQAGVRRGREVDGRPRGRRQVRSAAKAAHRGRGPTQGAQGAPEGMQTPVAASKVPLPSAARLRALFEEVEAAVRASPEKLSAPSRLASGGSRSLRRRRRTAPCTCWRRRSKWNRPPWLRAAGSVRY